MKSFKPCLAGCGRYGAFKNGVCDSCRHEKETVRILERDAKRKVS